MKTQTKIVVAVVIVALYLFSLVSFASALIVDADYITIYPGETGSVDIEIENNENFDIEDISVALILEGLPFTSVGSSEKDVDDIDEDDDDSAKFTLRASTGIEPGDYSIPYVVKYTNAEEDDANATSKTGSFGIRVSARTELNFAIETENNVIGQQGQLTLRIVNLGLGEVKSVYVKANPSGYTLLGSDEAYVGSVSSDDFETASFDVVFNSENAQLNAVVTYKDFDNEDQTETVTLPVKVYTREEALELGIIQRSNTAFYVSVVVLLILIWIIWRVIKRRKKKNNKKKE